MQDILLKSNKKCLHTKRRAPVWPSPSWQKQIIEMHICCVILLFLLRVCYREDLSILPELLPQVFQHYITWHLCLLRCCHFMLPMLTTYYTYTHAAIEPPA